MPSRDVEFCSTLCESVQLQIKRHYAVMLQRLREAAADPNVTDKDLVRMALHYFVVPVDNGVPYLSIDERDEFFATLCGSSTEAWSLTKILTDFIFTGDRKRRVECEQVDDKLFAVIYIHRK